MQTCEALETIDRLSDVRYRNLVDNYLNRDAPAIITDAMDSWAVMNTDYFWFDNITHVSSGRVLLFIKRSTSSGVKLKKRNVEFIYRKLNYLQRDKIVTTNNF